MDRAGNEYLTYLESFRACRNHSGAYDSLLERIDEAELSYATNVLVVGSGPAVLELKFLSKLTPNLKKATFVEPNTSCFNGLKDNLRSSCFSAKVETKTYQCNIQDWENSGETFDLILMFDSLYYLDEQDRRELLKSSMNQWLNPGGLIYIAMKDDKHHGDEFHDIYDLYATTHHRDIDTIKDDVTAIGKSIHKEYSFTLKLNLDRIGENVVRFFQVVSKPNKCEEDVRAAINSAKNKGYDGSMKECMCVLKNA